jgi:hypothetical protein
MLIDRPNRFHITRKGGHSDIELVSDGKTVTLYGRKANAYAQNALSGHRISTLSMSALGGKADIADKRANVR